MSESLPFSCILYDTLYFEPGELLNRHYELFTPNRTGNEISNRINDETIVTKKNESEIIRLIFQDINFRNLLFSELMLLDDYVILLEVGEPVARRGMPPGDIDVILYNKKNPRASIGIECKNINIIYSKNEDRDKIGRLEKIRKAVRQVNGLRKSHGFHLSYLLIFAKVYGVERSEKNVFFSSASVEALREIRDKTMNEPLHDDIGVVIVEIVQPTKKSIKNMGMIGVHVEKIARPCDQSEQLTNRITEAANNLK